MEAVSRKHELNQQAVSNLAWAYAARRTPCANGKAVVAPDAPGEDYVADLVDALTERFIELRSEVATQGLSITAWAIATLEKDGGSHTAFYAALEQEALKRASEFNQQSISNVAWSFATAGVQAPALFSAIAESALALEEPVLPQSLHNLLWSFARQAYAHDRLFQRMIKPCIAAAAEMTSQSLVGTAWAYAALGYSAPALFQALARESRLRLPELSAQGLANLAWAFAVVDVQGPEMDLLFGDGHFAERCHLVIGKEKAYGTEGSTHMEHLRQLHQWELWRQARSQAAVAAGHTAWPPLHEKLRATCHRVFASRKGRPSHFQRQVLETALSLGLDAEEEVIIEEGYSIDIVLTPSPEGHGAPSAADQAHSLQSKVAIEVDGPSHFLYRSQRPSGSTVLKRRQLRGCGWTLIPVPFFEWSAAAPRPTTKKEQAAAQREYLAGLLARASSDGRMIDDRSGG